LELSDVQELVLEEARKIYSETVVDHAYHPRNLGEIEDANGFAEIAGPCGDTMKIWIKIEGDIVAKASFMTDGCGPAIASGSMITEMVKGTSIREAEKIEQKDILHALGGLPEDSRHCALLAAKTLKESIASHKVT
jgi:nitrogen fixation NifU-like protein